MEMVSMAKDFIGLQKQAVDNIFDAMTSLQDQAEKTNRFLAKQMRMSDKSQDYVDQWRTIFKDSRDESRKLILESLTNVENYCEALKSNK